MSNARLCLRRLGDWLPRLWRLPEQCFLCGETSGDALLCPRCEADLPRTTERCPVCAQAFADGGVCGRCLAHRPAYAATHALLDYRPPVGALVQALKYHGELAVARHLGTRLGGLPDIAGDVIVPMPLHTKRLRERGFNQAQELSRPLARALALPVSVDGVVRVRETTPQEGLDRRAREANLRGAFRCARRFDGLRVLVVDDVMTTGSSLQALALSLRRAGAASVVNLVVARTPSD